MAWMARTISLIFAALLLTLQPHATSDGWLEFGTAHAANPMVELLSGGDVVGDGATAVTVHIVAYRSNGQPMNGSTLKVTAKLDESAVCRWFGLAFTPWIGSHQRSTP